MSKKILLTAVVLSLAMLLGSCHTQTSGYASGFTHSVFIEEFGYPS
jgi:hypothetical protein